jgi:hypothetical protein
VRGVQVQNPTWLPFLLGGGEFNDVDRPSWEGFRLKLGTTVRLWSLPSWLGARVAQVLLTANNGSQVELFGGTSLGVAFLPSNAVQLYAGGLVHSWQNLGGGPAAGIDIRLNRFLMLSGELRYDFEVVGSRLVAGGFLGAGYDL